MTHCTSPLPEDSGIVDARERPCPAWDEEPARGSPAGTFRGRRAADSVSRSGALEVPLLGFILCGATARPARHVTFFGCPVV